MRRLTDTLSIALDDINLQLELETFKTVPSLTRLIELNNAKTIVQADLIKALKERNAFLEKQA